MKKTVLFAAVFCLAITGAKAQIEKGNVFVGANLANLGMQLDETRRFSLLVEPKAAWFIQDKIALGGYVFWGMESARFEGVLHNLGIGALGRYYAGARAIDNATRARFFGEVTAGLDVVNPSFASTTLGVGVGAGPGITYFITPNVGLEGLVKYQGALGLGDHPASNAVRFNFGFQLYLSGQQGGSQFRSATY